MPTDADPVLVDTSAALALLLADHEQHRSTTSALDHVTLGLAGHAAFESYSVLTRLRPPARRAPAVVHHLLEQNFPATRFLSTAATAALFGRLATDGISGGAVYDALIAAVAVENDLELVTRDRRATTTYRAVGARVRLLP